jgi:hypothetical protein
VLEPVPEGREGERLHQVVQDPVGHRGPDHVEIPRTGDDHDVGVVSSRPHRARHLGAEHVGQVDVEQHQVDPTGPEHP